MRSETLEKTPSSSYEEEDDNRFYVKPNSNKPPESKKSTAKEENNNGSSQVNPKAKRHREEKGKHFYYSSSQKKKTAKESGIDLEEFLARTYPKDTSTPVNDAKQSAAVNSIQRSRRKKKRPAKKAPDSAKKWYGDEEICVAMALLKSCSPEGELNITSFYQQAKEALQFEVSSSQLYDKMRNMRKRFRSIQSKLKDQNITEEQFTYRTPQEPTLFKVWKQIWGNNGNISANEGENPRENEIENPRHSEFENPSENEAENPREIGAENPKEIGAENPREMEVENPREDEIIDRHTHDQREEEEEEHRHVQKSSSQKALVQSAEENGVCNMLQSEGKDLGKNMKVMFENAQARFEALMESSLNRLATAVNCQSFGGFGYEMGMGSCFLSDLSRRMKDLIDGVNSIKEFAGVDSTEARELQEEWRRQKLQEVKVFSESLELLQKQCKLFLRSVDTSNDNH